MIPLAISPCPNDTFLFYHWMAGKIDSSLQPQVSFADIQQLNMWALQKRFPLIKLSFHCFRECLADYSLLPVGAALGKGCGPKIIAKTPFLLDELPSKKIAIPGENTTAHFLLKHLLPNPKEKRFCLYHEISTLLDQGIVDCGLIIHESRFTFESQGFHEIIDLGTLWEKRYQLPLPLGGLALRNDVDVTLGKQIVRILRESLEKAWKFPEESKEFVIHQAQEKNWDVIRQHIDLYVTKESHSLSPEGKEAIEILLTSPVSSKNSSKHFWLFDP